MTTDPFDVLAGPDPMVTPDPDFVAALETRLVDLDETTRTGRAADRRAPAGGDQTSNREDVIVELGTLTPRPTRRRAWLVGGPVAAVALTAALVAVTVNDRNDTPVGPTPTDIPSSTMPTATTRSAPSTSSSATPSAGPELPPVRSLDVAGATLFPLDRDSILNPTYLTVAGDSVWVQWGLRTGDRLDRSTGQRIGDLPVNTDGLATTRPLAAFGSVWVTERDGTVVRVDARTGEVLARIAMPTTPGSTFWFAVDLVAAPDGVWTTTLGDEQRLVRIDAATNQVVANLPAPGGGKATLGSGDVVGLGYDDGSLWVALRSSVLHRLDPVTGDVQASVDLPFAPGFLAVGPGAAFVSGNDADGVASVARVDTPGGKVVGTVKTSTLPLLSALLPNDLVLGGGYVWLTAADAQLVQVDAATLTVVARYGTEAAGGNVVVVDGEVWGVIASSGAPTVYRMPVTRPG